ncbi:MAG: hypothetical protein WCF85_19990 [Rhodospirillaceae bacterium]
MFWTRIRNEFPVREPVWPGETIKGLLRATAFNVAVEALRAICPDYPGITLDRLYEQTKGGTVFTAVRADISGGADLRRAQPILSLFGAASPRLEGKLVVEPAMARPISGGYSSGLPDGARRDPVLASPHLAGLLTEHERAVWQRRSAIIQDAAAAKARLRDAERILYRAKLAGIIDLAAMERNKESARSELTNIEANPDFAHSMQRPVLSKPAVAAGVVYDHRIVGNALTDIEAGLLFATLETLGADPHIGGGRTTGHGRFSADYTIFRREGTGPLRKQPLIPVGKFMITVEGGRLETEDPAILRAIDAWEQAERNIASCFAIFGID